MASKVGKRGDTLVEVMLAVGIFSMVAVAVVAVMSGGTSSSQTSLETTLAREEIDTQAEALRFIHRAYVADVKSGTNSKYGTLWKDITDHAMRTTAGTPFPDAVTKYNPGSCDELYKEAADGGDPQIIQNNGFIINTRKIAPYAHSAPGDDDLLDEVIIRDINITAADTAVGYGLRAASTYPHLIFGHVADTSTELIDRSSTATGSESDLYAAEGIHIVAVADPDSTKMAGDLAQHSAYYDFYIRTCWYGTGDQSPSTISTVMRLYNPDITSPNPGP